MADVVVSVPVFSTKVTDSLLSFQQNSILCDCSIVCSDESVPAHQIILTIWGYQSMFQEKTEICANTYTAQDIRLFLKFLYTGKMSIPSEEVQKLSDIAKILGICLTTFETKCYMPSSSNSTETPSYPVNVVSLNDFIENMDSKREIESDSPYPVLLSKVEETSTNKAASTEELSHIKVETVDIEFDKALGEKRSYQGMVFSDTTMYSIEFQNTCPGKSLLKSSVLNKRKKKTNAHEGSKKKKGERALVEESVSNSDTSEPVEEPENNEHIEEPDSVVAGEIHPTSDTVKVLCSSCGKSFGSRSSLRQHELRHQGKGTYKCNICNKVFFSKANNERHAATHTGEKLHVCITCGAKFASARDLSRHEKRERRDFSFSCPTCGLPFEFTGQLRDHMSRHNGEKLHQCQECGRTFRYRNNLTRHMRLHYRQLNETQFKCDTCGKEFKEHRYLQQHKKYHCKHNYN